DDWGAGEEIKKALALQPGYWRAHYLTGRIALESHDLDKAVECAQLILAQTKDNHAIARAHILLSAAYSGLGNPKLVELSYRAMIQAVPKSAWYRGDFADWLIATGRLDEAIAMAKSAIALVDYPAARRALWRAYGLK